MMRTAYLTPLFVACVPLLGACDSDPGAAGDAPHTGPERLESPENHDLIQIDGGPVTIDGREFEVQGFENDKVEVDNLSLIHI